MSLDVFGATAKLPLREPVSPAENENACAGGNVVTTFWNVTSAKAWSATATGAPPMSGLPIVIDRLALARSPSVGSMSV